MSPFCPVLDGGTDNPLCKQGMRTHTGSCVVIDGDAAAEAGVRFYVTSAGAVITEDVIQGRHIIKSISRRNELHMKGRVNWWNSSYQSAPVPGVLSPPQWGC